MGRSHPIKGSKVERETKSVFFLSNLKFITGKAGSEADIFFDINCGEVQVPHA